MKRIIFALLLCSLNSFSQDKVNESLTKIQKNIGDNPNWDSLSNVVKISFPNISKDSVILYWQFRHYYKTNNSPLYTEKLVKFTERFESKTNPRRINQVAWDVFSRSNDSNELNKVKDWMSNVVKISKSPLHLDTYANLLYKTGNAKKAILVEKQSLKLVKRGTQNFLISDLALTYYKMLVGIPTWNSSSTEIKYSDDNRVWKRVKKSLSNFTAYQKDSIVMDAKISYAKKIDLQVYTKNIISFVEKFGYSMKIIDLNNYAYEIFLQSKDEDDLTIALKWSGLTIKDKNSKHDLHGFYDTYANILYKLGRQEEALIAMKKAVELSPENEKDKYKLTLSKIEQRLSVWNVDVK